jgi:hypothetical protein
MPKAASSSNAAPCKYFFQKKNNILIYLSLALARTIQAKKRRPKNAGKPRPPRDLIQKKL